MGISDSDLLALVRRESNQAESYIVSEIAQDRENAMERYLGEKYGDEQEGRSQVVSRDTLEVVEWAMPSLLRIFTSGDDIVKYKPVGPEDEEFAEQATDLANHIFYNDNNGFLILNSWFKDALLQKMGVLKTYWSEEEKSSHEEYRGLSEEEYLEIVSDEGVKVDKHTAYDVPGFEVQESPEDLDVTEPADKPEAGEQEYYYQPPQMHDVDITRTTTEGRIHIDSIPPEEFYISYSSADPDKADYLEHRARKTATQLIVEGFDKKIVDGLPDSATNDPTGERQTRMGNSQTDYEEHADNTMRELNVHESYVYVDTDDDGVAEWHQVIWVGDYILERIQIDHQPFSILTPIPIPHRAYGLSFADVTMDLERIKTVLLRQTLDNLYLSNNPEREVNVNKIVSMDDFMMTRPGGLKRVEEIGASREISYPFVAQHSFAMLDGLDAMISRRTGISDRVAGVDANALQNETATASNNNMAASNQRLEMTARIFAETGVKHLFRRILQLLVQNQDQARTIRLRGEWVEMDPRSWNAEMDVRIDVGLGHGNRDQQVGHLSNILMWQKDILASGGLPGPDGKPMVTPLHIFNTMERMVKTVGFKSADDFFNEPSEGSMPPPQQGADPQQALIQAQQQIEQMKAQQRMDVAQLKVQADDGKAQREHGVAMAKLHLEKSKIDIEREKIAAGLQGVAAKIDADQQKAADQLRFQAERELYASGEADKDRLIAVVNKHTDSIKQPLENGNVR